MDEIDAEIAGFVPGWYIMWSGRYEEGCADIDIINTPDRLKWACGGWPIVGPFHLVAHNFLPEGWRVIGPDQSLEQRPGIPQ